MLEELEKEIILHKGRPFSLLSAKNQRSTKVKKVFVMI
jgi:hypothetical protein